MKITSMDKAVQTELETLTGIILNTVPVERLILFGSYAYGTPHKGSDLDLYVVLKDGVELREIDAMLLIGRAIGDKQTMSVDVLVGKSRSYAERKVLPTIERKIARDGKVLWSVGGANG
ncbi:MAG: nucleotidyltransferase domain-containing protein [Treponema sp.]|nr:nucleotidyltransferase domain-containing protein [Treponema sp.]